MVETEKPAKAIEINAVNAIVETAAGAIKKLGVSTILLGLVIWGVYTSADRISSFVKPQAERIIQTHVDFINKSDMRMENIENSQDQLLREQMNHQEFSRGSTETIIESLDKTNQSLEVLLERLDAAAKTP